MAKARATRQAYDQVIQGVFADAAAKMSPAGRSALANWPHGRKSKDKPR
jgi:ribulose 1,5-bisphosphate carboxylase large subunit-like protein